MLLLMEMLLDVLLLKPFTIGEYSVEQLQIMTNLAFIRVILIWGQGDCQNLVRATVMLIVAC